MARLELELPSEKLAEIEMLMKKCGVDTKIEFLNNAFTLLKWAVKKVEEGKIIASVDEIDDSFCELTMAILSYVKANSPPRPKPTKPPVDIKKMI